MESEDGSFARNRSRLLLSLLSTVAGKEIVVPVSVDGMTGKDVISYEFDLRYDPSVIQPLENPVDVAGTVSRGLYVVAESERAGTSAGCRLRADADR